MYSLHQQLFVGGLVLMSVGCLTLAAFRDIAVRALPNWICTVLACMGLTVRIFDGTFVYSLIAAISVFLAAAFCWRRGWMGGGDVKLLGAAATLVPPAGVFNMVALIAFAGGGLAVIYLICRRLVRTVPPLRSAGILRRVWRAEAWRIRRGAPLPYACAIAAGAVMALFGSGI